MTVITAWIARKISLALDPFLGVPLRIVPRRLHILGLVTATCLILMGILVQPKRVGLVCVWRIGHARNVYAIFNHLAPGDGLVELGYGLARPLHITRALAAGQWILHFTVRPCLQTGLHIVMPIGTVLDLFVQDCVAQVQRRGRDDWIPVGSTQCVPLSADSVCVF